MPRRRACVRSVFPRYGLQAVLFDVTNSGSRHLP
jgi:hypothetical protein